MLARFSSAMAWFGYIVRTGIRPERATCSLNIRVGIYYSEFTDRSPMASGNWSNEETFKLIELWGDDRIQTELEGCKRNKDVYKKLAGGMVEAGHEKTAEQCREKVKKLKAEYRKVKDSQNRSAAG